MTFLNGNHSQSSSIRRQQSLRISLWLPTTFNLQLPVKKWTT
ncbi:hypothetical protein MAR_021975 [Mya arenaria]|uniref:Uncharacterized protein n=1 Tax=Mya arenaria TaxID=6604 RepID=A0ABY7ECI1_MYAAR|nr:hypothetical protein MAR_021975 [Mya arenaria]